MSAEPGADYHVMPEHLSALLSRSMYCIASGCSGYDFVLSCMDEMNLVGLLVAERIGHL